MKSITRETILDRRAPAFRWSAIFAGSIIAAISWIVLQLFGTGIALDSVTSNHDLYTMGNGSAVWSVIAPFIAMLIGGVVAGRAAATYDRGSGTMHAFVMWGLVNLVGALVIARFASSALAGSSIVVRDGTADTAQAIALGRVFLCGGLSLVTGLLGALLGGALGVRRERGTVPVGTARTETTTVG